jgi:hypothetical protein
VRFGQGPQYVDPSGRYFHMDVIGTSEYGSPPALRFVDRLRDDIVPWPGFPEGVNVYAGGGPPSGVDFLDLTYGAFPWLVVGVLLLTYVLLLRAFRSVILPLKAIILNLLSIGAAYGLLVMFFKWGGAGRSGSSASTRSKAGSRSSSSPWFSGSPWTTRSSSSAGCGGVGRGVHERRGRLCRARRRPVGS